MQRRLKLPTADDAAGDFHECFVNEGEVFEANAQAPEVMQPSNCAFNDPSGFAKATRFIKLIGRLFAAEARSETWTAERRQRLRRRYSAAVLDAIETLMLEQLPGVVPQSLLGRALTYLRGQWPKLIRYIENGNWPISNNPCENSIRPFCLGRRGWLFADTVDGANASANLYAPVETCKASGIDPYRYLTWLFQRPPLAKTVDDYDTLLPWKMAADLH
jgi:transposase